VSEQGAEENISTSDESGRWVEKRLHNEDLHNLYVSSGIIWVIKSRMMT
jgi:hypothetical protein